MTAAADDAISNTSPLLNSSPTKPLNFPRMNPKTKEFNSSSDTYTSEQEAEPVDEASDVDHKTLFDRNFSFEEMEDASKTVQINHVKPSQLELENFSTETPITSAVELTAQTERSKINTSPSKSIMKKNTPSASPTKKNVVFTKRTPEVHHYEKKDEITLDEDEYINIDDGDEHEQQSGYTWNSLPRNGDNYSSSDESSTPPSPPPHTTNNLTAIKDSDSEEPEDISPQDLKSIKEKKSYSSLTFNEKLDMFLARSDEGSNKANSEALDDHLNELHASRASQTDLNIHHLSLDLQTQQVHNIENPLNSLSRSEDVELKSGNTSRSSIQSLKDDDRVLESHNINTISKSVEMNDGIKGFSDHMVESLIPNENNIDNIEKPSDINEAELPRIGSLDRQFVDSSNDEFHDSFDQSYNNTEQSIMDLLKKSQPPVLESYVPSIEDSISAQGSKSNDQFSDPEVKIENEDEKLITSIKSEENDIIPTKIKEENSREIEESIHIFNIPGVPTAVKSEVDPNPEFIKRETSVHTLLPGDSDHVDSKEKVILQPEPLKEELPKDEDDQDEFDSLIDKSAQFSLRDHIDSDWKFEDSNDGDREDNDDYTNNDITQEILVSTKEDTNISTNGNVNDDRVLSHSSSREVPSVLTSAKESKIIEQDQTSISNINLKDIDMGVASKQFIKDTTDLRDLKIIPANLSEDAKEKLDNNINEIDTMPNLKSEEPENKIIGVSVTEKHDSDLNLKNSLVIPKVELSSSSKEIVDDSQELADGANDNDETSHSNDVHSDSKSNTNVEASNSLENSQHLALDSNELSLLFSGDERSLGKKKRILEVDLSPNVSADPDHIEGISLAPPKIKLPLASDFSKDEVLQSDPIPLELTHISEPENVLQEEDTSDVKQFNESVDEVLANSTNIAITEDITLPPVESNNYSSFEDITKTLDQSTMSFEDSLSAEHDKVVKPTNFISIWHSQNKNTHKQQATMNWKEQLQQNIHIPASLQPKKFKEVNVITRRVVSPGFEDLNVSGFLPELSQDSGFDDIKGIVLSSRNDNSQISSQSESGEINTKKLLPDIIEPVEISENVLPKSRLRPPSASFKPVVRVSRFKVPSFEIKRSSSILSPRDQYNDIFADTVKRTPTIKGQGMKTLPSMDKEDVQRILSTKRIISQEEYSRFKLVGNTKKGTVVEPDDVYDHLQQEASIHDAQDDESVASPPVSREPRDAPLLPHLADELLRIPSALLSKDQFFKESEFSSPVRANVENISSDTTASGVSSIIYTKKNFPHTLEPKQQLFPEPDPELCTSPNENIFKTPPQNLTIEDNLCAFEDEIVQNRLLHYDSPKKPSNKLGPSTPVRGSFSVTPSPVKSKKASPIKIGSPIRLVKNEAGVTSVELQSSPRKLAPETFTGHDLSYGKLRDGTAGQSQLATVAVPSVSTHNSEPTACSSDDRFKFDHRGGQRDASNKSAKAPLSERGRLFLRVVGLKNLDLPDLQGRKAEFSMTLDNGVHCIKTPNYKLDRNHIEIGKEFELTVGNSLEFILTMKASYEKPSGKLVEVKERRIVKPKNKFSRIFGNKDIITTTKFVPVDVKDSWANKFAQDGSFARCYVDLDQYEGKITGKVSNFDITCFNEWETIVDRNGERIKCKPYRIGQLEVKMMFIPRTLEQEALPSSIKSAYESINSLKNELSLQKEGYMFQEGGDCDSWKRRFFKLSGTSLIAHSEYSHKTRAKINLAKVVEVMYIDNEDNHGKYRNFSEVMLMEHSFKVRFGNGEIIVFGAPNRVEKMEWISIFEKIIHRNKFRVQPWVKIMMEYNNMETLDVSMPR